MFQMKVVFQDRGYGGRLACVGDPDSFVHTEQLLGNCETVLLLSTCLVPGVWRTLCGLRAGITRDL